MTLADLQAEPDAEAGEAAVGTAGDLLLRLEGFAGSLDLLLELARGHRIDLKALDLLAVVEQLIQATRSGTGLSLSRKADWTVTASWLLLLRSHLMLPAADPRQPAAADQAQRLQAQLLSLQEARALARWLDIRPQLGREMFARGAPEPGTAARAEPERLDRVEFLWACIALFDGDWSRATLELPAVYAPRRPDLHTVEDARARIRQHLADQDGFTGAIPMSVLLPRQERERPREERLHPQNLIRHRSAWTSTLMACLEMTRQGKLLIGEQATNEAITVSASALTVVQDEIS